MLGLVERRRSPLSVRVPHSSNLKGWDVPGVWGGRAQVARTRSKAGGGRQSRSTRTLHTELASILPPASEVGGGGTRDGCKSPVTRGIRGRGEGRGGRGEEAARVTFRPSQIQSKEGGGLGHLAPLLAEAARESCQALSASPYRRRAFAVLRGRRQMRASLLALTSGTI